MSVSEPTEFLLARYAEDEDGKARNLRDLADTMRSLGNSETADFLAREAARVLAECEAKRRIVERLSEVIGDRPPVSILDEDGWVLLAWETLYDLAAVYADHPDYREEWKP
jgi:hypothetical protein